MMVKNEEQAARVLSLLLKHDQTLSQLELKAGFGFDTAEVSDALAYLQSRGLVEQYTSEIFPDVHPYRVKL